MFDESEFPSLAGCCLIAMPGMLDARFERALIYICAHSNEGAMGFVINQTMDTPSIPDFLSQLDIVLPQNHSELPGRLTAERMHVGGPLEPGRGFVLHTPDFTSKTTVEISSSVCLTATIEILKEISRGTGPEKYILVLGYSGWAANQLEKEIQENAWLTSECEPNLLFDTADDKKYSKSLALMGVNEGRLSFDAGHA